MAEEDEELAWHQIGSPEPVVATVDPDNQQPARHHSMRKRKRSNSNAESSSAWIDTIEPLDTSARETPFGAARNVTPLSHAGPPPAPPAPPPPVAPVVTPPAPAYMIPRVDGIDVHPSVDYFDPEWHKLDRPPPEYDAARDSARAADKTDTSDANAPHGRYTLQWFRHLRYREEVLYSDPVYDFVCNNVAGLLSLADRDMMLDNQHLRHIETAFEKFLHSEEERIKKDTIRNDEVEKQLSRINAMIAGLQSDYTSLMLHTMPDENIIPEDKMSTLLVRLEQVSTEVDRAELIYRFRKLIEAGAEPANEVAGVKRALTEYETAVSAGAYAGLLDARTREVNELMVSVQTVLTELDVAKKLEDFSNSVPWFFGPALPEICGFVNGNDHHDSALYKHQAFTGVFLRPRGGGSVDASSATAAGLRGKIEHVFLEPTVIAEYRPTAVPADKQAPNVDTLSTFNNSALSGVVRKRFADVKTSFHTGQALVNLARGGLSLFEALETPAERDRLLEEIPESRFNAVRAAVTLFKYVHELVVEKTAHVLVSIDFLPLLYLAAYKCIRSVTDLVYAYELAKRSRMVAGLNAKYIESIKGTIERMSLADIEKIYASRDRIVARFKEQMNPALSGYFVLNPIVVANIRRAETWIRQNLAQFDPNWFFFSAEPVITRTDKMDEPFRQVFAEFVALEIQMSRERGGIVITTKLASKELSRTRRNMNQRLLQFTPAPRPLPPGASQTEVPTLYPCMH